MRIMLLCDIDLDDNFKSLNRLGDTSAACKVTIPCSEKYMLDRLAR